MKTCLCLFQIESEPFGESAVWQVCSMLRATSSGNLVGREAETRALRDFYESLTPRERQVMTMVAAGLLNKQVGGELNISEISVKAHRGQVMRKMKADSLADLVNMVARLRLARSPKN
jgi:FixJ family two-component response regulator